MYSVRNLHTYIALDSYGSIELESVVSAGVIDTAAAGAFGVYYGDPASMTAGSLDIWPGSGGGDPSEESWVRTTGASIWTIGYGGESWPEGTRVQFGLIYAGPDATNVEKVDNNGYYGDGYVRLLLSYDAIALPLQIVWAWDTSGVPPEPTYFWTRHVGTQELP